MEMINATSEWSQLKSGQHITLQVQSKTVTDESLFIYFFFFIYLSDKIRLDVSCESKFQVLFFLKN